MTTRAKRSHASKISSPNSKVLRKIAAVIRKGRRFLVAAHVNPDGDTLGSALALGLGLKGLRKKVRIYNRDPVPYSLEFLPESREVANEWASGGPYDATFLVDCADFSRVGDDFSRRPEMGSVIVLDHHARSGREGDLNFVDVAAASSGMVVFKVLKAVGARVTPEIAENVYVTLVSDTGNFRYANTTPEVLRLAYELVRSGVRPEQISRSLYETAPPEKMKLLARVLETLELYEDGRIGVVTLTRATLRETGGTLEMAEDFVEYPRSLKTVEAAVFLKETDEGCKVSLRSKEFVDVAEVAARLGGGGHVRAAGCTFSGGLEEAKRQVLKILREVLIKRP